MKTPKVKKQLKSLLLKIKSLQKPKSILPVKPLKKEKKK